MTPRTISGQAVVSGMRLHLKRAFTRTVVAIETEAAAPYAALVVRLAPDEPIRDADGNCAWCAAADDHAPECAYALARELLARDAERAAEVGD